ncbi:phytoene desaturase family protein [Jannaschia formosa]|uniref:phytoene desaturase family protein n=1 Tax=Jannaschia formosa TaxID=2259592 RepID=UPI000E1BB13F|nr:phytoene desaturase family protein [Jannaschia formosa]TFL17401.1 phytoene desaturase [Jannaschia formosa]
MPRDTTQPPSASAVVIGGGLGGMAAALRLRARGYAVRLIDRCPRLGGRAQVYDRDGFRFDAGPTLLTAPHLLEELFGLFGRRLRDHVTLVQPDPWYRFAFADGETMDYGPTLDRTLEEIARLSPGDVRGFRDLLDHSRAIHDAAFTDLSHAPFHAPAAMLRQLPDMLRLRSYRTVWQMVSGHLQDDRLRRAFSIQPLLIGGNPYQTTSLYGLITHLEHAHGIWFAMGGTGALVEALARLMAEEGVEIETGTTVERVLIEGGRAAGVEVEGGRRIAADIVVSNVDPVHLYREMLPPGTPSPLARARVRTGSLSMGVFVLHFGTRRVYEDVAHHTIVFGDSHRRMLDDVFRKGVLGADPSVYLHRPTATDPSLAPPGCDGFYALCPVPNLGAGHDWSVEGPRLRDRIVSMLERRLLPLLSRNICAEFAKTPEDFAEDYLSVQGAGFSLSPVFRQSAFFRFHNRGEGVPGLFLVGAGTHPGAGVPGVISSAKVLDRLVPAPAQAA